MYRPKDCLDLISKQGVNVVTKTVLVGFLYNPPFVMRAKDCLGEQVE
jgi:hypothetical protein